MAWFIHRDVLGNGSGHASKLPMQYLLVHMVQAGGI